MEGILEDTMARGLLMLRLTMEAMAMVVTMARGLLIPTTEVTTMAAMAHTAMASKLHGNIHSL